MFDTLQLPVYKEGEYEAYNSSGVEREVGEFLHALVRVVKPQNIMDLGTAKGISSAYMALGCRDNRKGLVETVEFDPQHYEEAQNLWRVMDVTEYIHFYKMNVDDYAPAGLYEIIFIDTEPSRRFSELLRFYPNLKDGGFIGIHDLPVDLCQGNVNPEHKDFPSWPYGDVPLAMKELLQTGKLVRFHLPTPRDCAFFYKPPERFYHA